MTNNVNTAESREVTIQELVASFAGKHVDISPSDHYGISISMKDATLELEDDESELYLVSRDSENRVTGLIRIDEDSIDYIEKFDNGTYTVNFSLFMTSIDIAEYKSFEQMKKECARKNLKVVK